MGLKKNYIPKFKLDMTLVLFHDTNSFIHSLFIK